MNNKININQKYGKLTTINRAEDSINLNRKSKPRLPQWNCKCECGNQIIVLASALLRGRAKHCGCLTGKVPLNNYKPGDKFNRLTLIEYSNGKWRCRCDCGKEVTVLTYSLTSKNTKSCGCLNKEQNVKKTIKMQENRRKFSPEIASARRIWKRYIYADKSCNLSFEEWLTVSKQNCTYCGQPPSKLYNGYDNRASKKSKIDGYYIYNGIDRVDSNQGHTKDNIVPCCYVCNRNKNNLSLKDFLQKIKKLKINNFIPLKIKSKKMPKNKSLTSAINYIFYNYKKDTDLTINQFYYLIQLPCYYCGEEKVNKINPYISDSRICQETKDKAWLHYNGIDRVDSSKGHTKDNVVPCCKYCNFGKGKMSILEFNQWIATIKNYNNT